jgi:uncharacterized protein YeaO (DUF488 family)
LRLTTRQFFLRPPLQRLRALLAQGPVTLVYAARDEQSNSARVLAAWLGER